jgi:hypothetical protein
VKADLATKLAGYVPQPRTPVRSVPSIVRTSQWMARRGSSMPRSDAGPVLNSPSLVARNGNN